MELTLARRLAALALLLHLGVKLHSPVSVELDALTAGDFCTELNRESIRVIQSEQLNARQSVFDKFTQVPHALKERPRERFFFFHERDNNFIAMLGNFFAAVLGGAIIVETVFALPGIGSLALDAIHYRDYPLLQGYVLFLGGIYVLVTLAVDLVLARMDPRIVLGGGD